MDILLQSVTKSFGKLTVLDGLDLSFPHGKLTALLGPSGCGKTTILNLIVGVLHPDRGRVLFGDRDMTQVHLSKRNIGYVFQNYALYPNMTAYENLKFPLTNHPIPGATRSQRREFYDSRIHGIAKLLRIEDTLNRYPSELSGGQQQRVALGRALIRKPDILLMDEPFANLDRKLSIQMREEIRQIQQQTGITTIFVTHNQSDANAISDRVVLLNEGTVQQEGSPSLLYEEPANLFVADFFGEHGSNIVPLEALIPYCPTLHATTPPRAVTVAFRPEDLSLIPGNGPFTVTGMTRMGGSYLHQLRCGELHLQSMTSAGSPPGTHVSILLQPEHISFYDGEGRRIVPQEG